MGRAERQSLHRVANLLEAPMDRPPQGVQNPDFGAEISPNLIRYSMAALPMAGIWGSLGICTPSAGGLNDENLETGPATLCHGDHSPPWYPSAQELSYKSNMARGQGTQSGRGAENCTQKFNKTKK